MWGIQLELSFSQKLTKEEKDKKKRGVEAGGQHFYLKVLT